MAGALICPRQDTPLLSVDVADSRLSSKPWWLFWNGVAQIVNNANDTGNNFVTINGVQVYY